ncbi:MAG: sigma-70 family RNA polymerase sigma factor [Betaproteobacteria bacterium]
MEKDDDQTLLKGSQAGDRAAFTALVTRYQRPIYNAAYRVLGNTEDANDIVQIVFLRIAERLDDYDPQFRFFSWIYRIAINESINMLRHHRREEPLADEVELPDAGGAGPEQGYRDRQLSDRVQRALMSMKVEDRVVLTLRHFSELSYRDIGEVLSLEEKTVKSRIFEARHRLSEMLGELRIR